jgi:acyl-coenzyme A thioesterase PaaI-like protein
MSSSPIKADTFVEFRVGLEHVSYFKSIPWCAAIINDPKFTAAPTTTRIPKKSGEDAFFGKTLQTPDTVIRCLTVCSVPDDSLDPPIQEAIMFFEVGSGVNGYPNVCHGGFVATMLDEVTGTILNVNQVYGNNKTGRNDLITHMTGYLNTRYLAPVPAPGIILATAKVAKVEGRKLWINGTLEDSQRRVMAQAESLFIQAKTDPRARTKL